MNLRVAGITPCDMGNGPGVRYTVFVQGCSHHCPKCQNPSTWSVKGGVDKDIADIIHEISKEPRLSGLTVSGGEPLQQPEAVATLVRDFKHRFPSKNIWLWTGYTLDEIEELRKYDLYIEEILTTVNVLVVGPYEDKLQDLTLPYMGSSNQQVVLSTYGLLTVVQDPIF